MEATSGQTHARHRKQTSSQTLDRMRIHLAEKEDPSEGRFYRTSVPDVMHLSRKAVTYWDRSTVNLLGGAVRLYRLGGYLGNETL